MCKPKRFAQNQRRICGDARRPAFSCTKWTDSENAHWFVDVPGLLDRPHLYNDEHGDYWDNPLRFGVFCKAASQLSKEFDVLHLHDWQSGLTALYNRGKCPSVISIHNLAYQGLCGFEWADRLEIPIIFETLVV